MTDLFANMPNFPDKPDEEPIEAELAPDQPLSFAGPAPLNFGSSGPAGIKAIPATELAERAIAGRVAAGIAVASWVPALGVIVGGPLVVFFHLRLLLVNLEYWFLPLAALLGLALGLSLLAFFRIPEYRQGGRRGTAIVCVSIGGLLFCAATAVMIVCTLMMPAILHLKTDAGIAALQQNAQAAANKDGFTAEQRQKLQAAEEKLAAAQAKLNKRHDEISTAHAARLTARQERAAEEKKIAEAAAEKQRLALAAIAAEQRQREEELKRADKPGTYRQALHARLTKGDDSSPLPEYAGPAGERNSDLPLEWSKLDIYPSLKALVPDSPESPIDGSFAQQGIAIRRLKLAGEDFVPQALVHAGSVWLLPKDGKLLQFGLTDWQPDSQYPLKSQCQSFTLVYDGDYQRMMVCTDSKLIRLSFGRTYDKMEVNTGQKKLPLPRQVTITEQDELEVATGGEVPLIATWKNNLLTTIREQERHRAAAPSGAFTPGQYGRRFAIDRDGVFYVSRPEGIFRGELPKGELPYSRVKFDRHGIKDKADKWRHEATHTATISLDGRHVINNERRWPVESIAWKNVLPAAGIDPEKFAQLSADRLVTCSEQHNLLIYNTSGQQILAQNFPGAGKTLAIVGAPQREMVFVFTEKRIFVVTPDFSQPDLTLPTARYPTLAWRVQPRESDQQPELKKGVDQRFGDQEYKATNLTFGTEYLWGHEPHELFALDKQGVISKFNVATHKIEKTLPLGDEDYKDPYFIRQLELSQAGLVAVLPNLEQVVVIDPKTLEVRRIFDFYPWDSPKLATHPRSPFALISIPTFRGQRIEMIDLRNGGVTDITSEQFQPAPTQNWNPRRIGLSFGPRGETVLIGGDKKLYCFQITPTGFERVELPPQDFEGAGMDFDVNDETNQVLIKAWKQVTLCDLETKVFRDLLQIAPDTQARFGLGGKSIVVVKPPQEYNLRGGNPQPIGPEKMFARYSPDGKMILSRGVLYEPK